MESEKAESLVCTDQRFVWFRDQSKEVQFLLLQNKGSHLIGCDPGVGHITIQYVVGWFSMKSNVGTVKMLVDCFKL